MTAIDEPTVIETARNALRGVWDPELGIDILSLGLIYDVRLEEDGLVIEMTLTTPGCPVSDQLPSEAVEAVRRVLPRHRVRVEIVWEPPWDPGRMSEQARSALGFDSR